MLISAVATATAPTARATAQTAHFARSAERVFKPAADGKTADEETWRATAEAKLTAEVEHLEAALPRLREGFAAARALVPLSDPAGTRRTIDLSGKGWGMVELSFRAEPSAQELDALRRALAQELQIRPLERRARPVRTVFAAMGALALAAGLVAVVLHWRRKRSRTAPRDATR